jgi:cyanophycin synthetase
VKGFCYRIAVCGERILFARAHMPKGVKADGKHTVTELAEMATQSREKMPPWLMKKPFVIDDLARSTLASDGLTPESIPPEGQFVRLRPILREDWGAEFETLTDRIHPDNVAAAVTACKAMGLTMGGVDLITPDITVPWHKNGAIINEINYMPQVLKDIDDDARAAVARVALQGEGDGRIPVHFVTGVGERDTAARDLRSQLAGEGETCHLVSTEICEDPEGKALPLRGLGTLFERVLAMLGRPDVESLIVAAPADTFVQSGWPVDRLAKVHVLAADDGAAEATWQAIDARIATGGFARL